MSLPPSSPRLPSPPPPTEIQIGPKSPSLNSSSADEPSIEQGIIEANSQRRIHPGTKSADMAAGPPLVLLSELDSAFQLQEHLKALHYHYSKPSSSSNSTTPITRETAALIASPPDNIDRALWLFELCRFLINKCNDLIIGFLFDDPPCSAVTCPEMRASEWQFLCAVHESPKSCCAIDYCCHTLDWATNIVTSQKLFPSRLSLGGDQLDEKGQGVKHLTNIFRRLHRIFAHAWFQHRGVFWQVEGQTGLYVLFKTVCDTYELLPAENYKLPPEAEGLEPVEEIKPSPSILKSQSMSGVSSSMDDDYGPIASIGRTHTRRHIRQSPSVGSAVTTVQEADEEEADVTQRLEGLSVTAEEKGVAEVPVIVESYDGDETTRTPIEAPRAEGIEKLTEVLSEDNLSDVLKVKQFDKKAAVKVEPEALDEDEKDAEPRKEVEENEPETSEEELEAFEPLEVPPEVPDAPPSHTTPLAESEKVEEGGKKKDEEIKA